MAPSQYTHGHHESVLRSHTWRTMENSAAYLVPHLRAGLDVLDVGCGPGTITLDLAERVRPGRVMGLDPSQDVIATARGHADDRGDTTTELTTGDVYALAFADDSFDVVHAHQVLQHLADPVAALREMARVTRPGGLVAARDADYAAMCWWPLVPGLDRWLEVYEAVARSNDAEPDAGRRLLGWSQQAGLADVTPSASVWCYATPAERDWWGSLWADRITRSDLATQAVDRGLSDADELAELGRAWREWAAAPDGWFTVVHGEILARV
ncbi:methyltransferase domain-containing protein [Arsenicicoccus piscis]|uniref:Methyltransferase domain-containing protein n=1 Tax=Arsenicicoccus piscis TaxID=673954 RepID=A0ABQ6HLN7_9MICO|nr:methyltransferase domain-containing protein [Arsenicicoccus piscis]MCH8628714.1 methyltransferase domain-containing protein [Arsenicicoccus piscis]GMA19345.1 hypothetical protein GCM10025862_13660 [Arsenicicoccus piscis]